ncbi:MAG: hypothetical protein KDI79_18455, partial [Anaerolineae bacterium]|nr:hypothetical protein [Anaerolineae bacterium]
GRPYYWLKFDNNLTIGQGIDGRLYAGGGGGWRYPDGNPLDGVEEWEPATLGVGNVQVNTVEIDPDNPAIVYQGIADFGPYKSTDQGQTFSRILGNGWPVTTNNFEWNGPYYSNYTICQFDCSNSCNQTGALAFGGTTDFAISNQNSDVVYSAFGSGSNQNEFGGVNKSTDGGRTWQPLGFQAEDGFALNPDTCVPYGFRHLAIDPINDQIVLAAMAIPSPRQGILYRTIDGGLTWTQTFSSTSFITGLEISPLNPERVVLTTMWDVFHSTAAGAAGSWQDITPPNADLLQTVAVSPHDEGVYVVGTNDQGLFYTDDAGETWQNNPLRALAEQKLRQGSDQPLDSRLAADLNPAAKVLKNVSAIVFDPVAKDTFYIGGTRYTRASFGVAKITEAGQQWQHLPLNGLTHRNIFDLAVDTSGQYLYAGTFDGTFKMKLR